MVIHDGPFSTLEKNGTKTDGNSSLLWLMIEILRTLLMYTIMYIPRTLLQTV